MRSSSTFGITLVLGFVLPSSLLACASTAEADDAEVDSAEIVRREAPPDLDETVHTIPAGSQFELWFRAEHATTGVLELKGAPDLTARLDIAQQATDVEGTGVVYIDPCTTLGACRAYNSLDQDYRTYLVRVRNTGTKPITVTQRTLPNVSSGTSIEESDRHSVCRTPANGPGYRCSRLCGPNKPTARGECMVARDTLTLPKTTTVVGRCNATCN